VQEAFAIIGTGRLGRALASALATSGARVTGWNRSAARRDRFGEAVPGATVSASMARAVEGAGTVLLTVSDDALPLLADELAAAREDWNGRLVAHCSGRTGIEPLEPLAARGADIAALHPVMAFAGQTDADAARLQNASWAVTAPAGSARDHGFALVRRLGGHPFAVGADVRALYHAALTHAINHLVTITAQGTDLLSRTGAPDPAAVLRPAMEAALANALARGTAAATGPVVRGDAGTIAAHVAALEATASDVLDAYVAMTRAGIDAALAAGRIDEEQAGQLRQVLPPRG